MQNKIALWWAVCCLYMLPLAAQERPISNTTAFADGIYSQFSDFQMNKPSHSLRYLSSFNYETDRENNKLILAQATIDRFRQQGIALDSAWGLCINQTPYVRVSVDSAKMAFIRLYVVGKLCYFYYRETQNEEVVMGIYNPVTQKKMAERPITNKKRVTTQKMFKLTDGIIRPYSEVNLGEAMRDDEKLYKTWLETAKPIKEEALFKMLLIYNERNPMYLPK